MLADLITGLPDAPVIPEHEQKTFMNPEVQAQFTDIKITEKKGVYTLTCTFGGKKMPKKTLSDIEARWIDYGVANGQQIAARLYLYGNTRTGFSGSLF